MGEKACIWWRKHNRFALYKGYGIGEKAELINYEDKGTIADYALEAMKWPVGERLVKGRSETKLEPKGNITRVEMATILQRFIERIKGLII